MTSEEKQALSALFWRFAEISLRRASGWETLAACSCRWYPLAFSRPAGTAPRFEPYQLLRLARSQGNPSLDA
jgi:hypothetical protein